MTLWSVFQNPVTNRFVLGRKEKKHRPLLIHSKYEFKAKILSKSLIFHQANLYENILISADMTKAEQARHKLLDEQLKSRRAIRETDIIIQGRVLSLDPNPKDSKLRSRILEVVHCK